jgi:hypothetical protein
LKNYGSEQQRSRQLEQDFTDISFDFTCKLAQSKGIDYTKIEAVETDRLRRTLAIMHTIGKPRSEVDFTVIQNNLKYCPNIVELLKQKWFDDRINRRDASHPLMSLLEFKEPDYDKIRRWSEDLKSSSDNPLRQFAIGNAIANELEPLAQLEYIDKALGIFLKGEQPKTERLKRGFGDAGGFYPTLGELILSAHFKSSYPSTEIEYKVTDNRPVDCKVDINGATILVEIISPEMSKELKYVKIVVEMENRATEKIKEEKLKKQIPDIAADTACSKLPIFLAINTTRGIEIDDIDVENSLYDISQDPTGKLLSGIIHYRMHFDKADYQMKLQGYIHKNSSAERSVPDEVIDNMRNALFKKPLT